MRELKSYNEFKEFINQIKDEKIYFYFTGTKNDSGVSWCIDCAMCESFIRNAMEQHTDLQFVFVDVGGAAEWSTLDNPYRSDKDVHLTVIPTIILWKTNKRLDGANLIRQKDVLEMIFSDEEEH